MALQRERGPASARYTHSPYTDAGEALRRARGGRAFTVQSFRVVFAVTGPATEPPLDAAARDTYCGYV